MKPLHVNPSLEGRLPPLSVPEYRALVDDIRAHGVAVPIVVDSDTGEVVEGHHRLRACQELKIDPPVVLARFKSEGGRAKAALRLNLLRRQLDPLSWGLAYRKLLEVRGVGRGQGSRNDLTSATIAEVAKELGVSPRTATSRLALADRHVLLVELEAKLSAIRIVDFDSFVAWSVAFWDWARLELKDIGYRLERVETAEDCFLLAREAAGISDICQELKLRWERLAGQAMAAGFGPEGSA